MNSVPGSAVATARAVVAPLATAFSEARYRLYLVGGLVRDDLLGRVRDDVDYDLTTTNDSAPGSPPLDCTVTDVNLGVDQDFSLAMSGDQFTESTSVAFNFPTANPFSWCSFGDGVWLCTNTADVSCSPRGFPNQVGGSDSVDVVVIPAQVLLTVMKDGDAFGKVGDPVDYTITIGIRAPSFL